jgi:hypothetical protein
MPGQPPPASARSRGAAQGDHLTGIAASSCTWAWASRAAARPALCRPRAGALLIAAAMIILTVGLITHG